MSGEKNHCGHLKEAKSENKQLLNSCGHKNKTVEVITINYYGMCIYG